MKYLSLPIEGLLPLLLATTALGAIGERGLRHENSKENTAAIRKTP